MTYTLYVQARYKQVLPWIRMSLNQGIEMSPSSSEKHVPSLSTKSWTLLESNGYPCLYDGDSLFLSSNQDIPQIALILNASFFVHTTHYLREATWPSKSIDPLKGRGERLCLRPSRLVLLEEDPIRVSVMTGPRRGSVMAGPKGGSESSGIFNAPTTKSTK